MIILTSFAPSPIAKVIAFGFFFFIIINICFFFFTFRLTNATTSCFYLGDTLQAITALAESEIFITRLVNSGLCELKIKASPEIIKAY